MSASEKLKALDGAMPDAPWFYEAGIPDGGDRTGSVWRNRAELVMSKPPVVTAQQLLALRNALPQIVAVTSAAEAADDAFENYRNAPDGELSDYAVEEVMAKLVNQRIALSFLEEALS